MPTVGKRLRSLLGQHYNDILLASWYISNIILVVFIVVYKVDGYWFLILMLITGGIYHLLRKFARKWLTAFFISAIVMSLAITTYLVLNKGY
jgi:hypothetical protein